MHQFSITNHGVVKRDECIEHKRFPREEIHEPRKRHNVVAGERNEKHVDLCVLPPILPKESPVLWQETSGICMAFRYTVTGLLHALPNNPVTGTPKVMVAEGTEVKRLH